MPGYEIESLCKVFGKARVLDHVTLRAGAGEFVVILGPTGAGKTTLLRCVSGLEKVDGGAVREDGVEITGRSPAERDMAMVFQNFSLYPRLSVFENLAFPLRPKWRGMGKGEIDRRVRWAAELLGMTGKLGSMPTELSGGQQQRVAIGRAIVREPKLFLFDEPLASLDAKLRESMAVEIHRLQRRLNVTMLYVTHDQVEAMSLADRIVVLDGGKVLQVGTPEEIYRRPVSGRVARMLGSPAVNLFSVEEFCGIFAGRELEAGCTMVGVRPENLVVMRAAEGTARVRVVEHLGAMTVAYLVAEVGGRKVEMRAVVGGEVGVGDLVGVDVLPGEILCWR